MDLEGIRATDMSILRRAVAYVVLISVYGFTWVVAAVGGIIPRQSWKPNGRIMVTGTFHNPNWYLSHITPLARSGIDEVILVVDKPQLPLEKVRFVCPPKWAARLFTRAGAKAIWMIVAGFRYRPDLYMGYHLAPGACSALMAAKLLGRPACYQMTAGPVEIIGGGIHAAESMGAFLGRPSRVIETLALAVARSFDLIVVRGQKARDFLIARDMKGSIAIVTGSVNGTPVSPHLDRPIHLVFVGRLAPTKQVDQFVAIVQAVSRTLPAVRAAIVGDGPLLANLKAEANRLGVADRIEFLGKRQDVKAVLLCSRVFVLTSESEGLSIAMAEAMAAGVVPVVASVGELSDLVVNGENGYLVEPGNIGEYTQRIIPLLQDDTSWAQYSCKAIEASRKHCDIGVVSEKWGQYLRGAVARASGICWQEVLS